MSKNARIGTLQDSIDLTLHFWASAGLKQEAYRDFQLNSFVHEKADDTVVLTIATGILEDDKGMIPGFSSEEKAMAQLKSAVQVLSGSKIWDDVPEIGFLDRLKDTSAQAKISERNNRWSLRVETSLTAEELQEKFKKFNVQFPELYSSVEDRTSAEGMIRQQIQESLQLKKERL